MGGHQISMAVGAEFTRRRTICGREWVEIRSVWPLVLNLRDNARPLVLNSQDDGRSVGENGWKSDQYGRWC
jgi:hypothetical protein